MPVNESVSKRNAQLRRNYAPVKCSFIWTVVEHLQELTSAQVKHKLGIYTKVVRQSEARGVLLPIICELLAQVDKHAVKPTQYVR
jgi:hypothetical protein